jgi:hypothetical protein
MVLLVIAYRFDAVVMRDLCTSGRRRPMRRTKF